MRVFVTGASGWIGSAVVPELLSAGHEVVGLARSEAAAATLDAAGAGVQTGSIDDLAALRAAAAASDAVLHLAFRHDIAFSGHFAQAAASDRRAVETFGQVLAGSGRPLVIASGTLGLAPGRVATELDGRGDSGAAHVIGGGDVRMGTGRLALDLAGQGVRSSVLRLPPTVHGAGDHGFIASLVQVARDRGVSGYVGDGANRWPAVHRFDAAHLFCLALEHAPGGAALHAVADEGVPIRAVAEVVGRHLGLPLTSIDPADAPDHFGWLAPIVAADSPASSTRTRQLLGWEPTGPSLLADLEAGHYFDRA